MGKGWRTRFGCVGGSIGGQATQSGGDQREVEKNNLDFGASC